MESPDLSPWALGDFSAYSYAWVLSMTYVGNPGASDKRISMTFPALSQVMFAKGISRHICLDASDRVYSRSSLLTDS